MGFILNTYLNYLLFKLSFFFKQNKTKQNQIPNAYKTT